MKCNEKVPKSSAAFSCKHCEKYYKSNVGLWRHSKKCWPSEFENEGESDGTMNGSSELVRGRDGMSSIQKPRQLPTEKTESGNLRSLTKGVHSSLEQKLVEDSSIPLRNDNVTIEIPTIDAQFMINLIKKNQELQDLLVMQNNQMREQCKQQSELIIKLADREPINNISNNTTNNNQKFNLNFFLNETCKDAMNIHEFIENIKITFHDLMAIGETGFVNGVSDIFVKQLRDLEVNKRPIHCTDAKRETIYLKENDSWNKDDKDNNKLKDIIEKVEYKNVAALHQWCNENPDSKTNNSPNNLLRDKIYLQTLQGDDKTRDKIIKNISKEVVVEKEDINVPTHSWNPSRPAGSLRIP